MRLTRAMLLAAACACGDAEGATGIDLAIRYDPALGLDRFALTATAGGEPLVARTLLPEANRPLSESGREGVVLLLPDEVADGEVLVRVDGMARGQVIAGGQVTVRVAAGALVPAALTLRPSDAGCTDWDWTPSNLVPCADGPAPGGPLVLERDGTWRLDTGDGRLLAPGGDPVAAASELVAQAGGPMLRLLAVDQLVVDPGAVLEVTGPHPLAIAVWGEATIAGAIEVSGGAADCADAEAGGDAGDGASGAGGGGGGGFAADGGDGGDGHGDEKGERGGKGRASGDPSLVPLRGGCPGAPGGDAAGAPGSGGAGGPGGGAIHIAARDALAVSGTLRAAGSGGGGGAPMGGGGGGGSGGAILLESPVLRLGGGASLCANGGAGGEGGGGAIGGGDGAAGTCSEDRAAPADQAPDGGDGGRGSAGDSSAGEGGKAGSESGAGGGGGGGIGRVRLRGIDDLVDLGALVTPAAG